MHRRVSSNAVGLLSVLAVVLIACSPTPDQSASDVYLPTYMLSGDAVPAGDIEGQLTLEEDCLWIDTGEQRYLALWPEGSEIDAHGDSISVILPAGDTLTVGGSIYVGGGEVTDQDFLVTLVDSPVPEVCSGQPGWLITEGL